MSIDWHADVMEFHRKFCPQLIGTARVGFAYRTADIMRWNLIEEEFGELDRAWVNDDIEGFADAIGDLIYVLIGHAITSGIDMRPIWDAIHAANMAKEGGHRREDGKVLKPPGWVAPDIAGVLDRQPRLTVEAP